MVKGGEGKWMRQVGKGEESKDIYVGEGREVDEGKTVKRERRVRHIDG